MVDFAIHRHESAMGGHGSHHPETPPTSLPTLAPGLSTLLHESNLHWSFILLIVIYMFQCYSLRSSHPHLLPQSPKFCSLFLCLLLAHIYSHHYHLSKFHIYVLIYCIGVFLSDLLRSV